MIGKTYYERGRPVVVICAWRGGKLPPIEATEGQPVTFYGVARGGPRNVLIRRQDGELVVRPFRGLRRSP
jgi:acetyl esterase